MVKKKRKSPLPVLIAIALGVIVGQYVGKTGTLFGINLFSAFELLGKLFINSLTLIVVPLVASSIITGIAKMGNDSGFGRLSAKIFGFYFITTLSAVLIGLFFVNVLNPGKLDPTVAVKLLADNSHSAMQEKILSQKALTIPDVILQIIPPNIVDAFHGQMLGLIFVSLLFGYALSKIAPSPQAILLGFWQGIFQTTIAMTDLIMKFLPIGVFCLVAQSFAISGIQALKPLALFCLTVVAGLATFSLIALPLLLKVVGKVNPITHFKAMSPALITAFSTSSSAASLPITIECVEQRAGVSNRICSLVVPLGTSINMSGSALYECVGALFIAQFFGIEISFTTQFSVVLLSLLTSMGVAGIPSASIVAMVMILKAIGLPTESIGILLAVDRVLDMCRTTVNVFSDSCCAVLVAKSEGEKEVLVRETFDEVIS